MELENLLKLSIIFKKPMDINIKRQEMRNAFQDARPKISEVSVNVSHNLPKILAYWSAASRWALIVLAALAPVFFLPFTNLPVAANKEILAFVLIGIAFFALLGRVLIEGRIRYPGHLLTVALAVLVLVFGISAFFSLNQITSLIGPWASPDSFFAIFLFSILALSIVMTFDRRDIILSLLVFLASLSLLGLLELLQLARIFILPFDFAKNSGFNPVGSVNDVGVLLGFGLIIASGLMSTPDVSKLLKRLLALSVVVFLLNLAIIDFWAIWVGLALAMVFIISFLSAGLRGESVPALDDEENEYQGLQIAYFQKAWLPSIILLISIMFLFIQSPLSKFVETPVEVSPTFGATLDIGLKNLKDGHYLLGSGPGTFGYIFNSYKPEGINQTIFWSTIFTSGASAMASWVGTIGMLGVLALMFLIVAFIWTGIAGTSVRNSSKGIMNVASQSIFVGVCYLFIMWFLYAANFTNMAFVFWGIGLFLAASLFFIKEDRVDGSDSAHGSVFRELRIFTSPPKTFLFSLLIVGLMVFSVVGIYFEASRYIAETRFAKKDYAGAIKFWRHDERYYQGLSQSTFLQLNDLLAAKDLPQEEARARFQNITTNAVAAARFARDLNPQNPFNETLLGNIYENLIPYITDASNFARSSYAAAAALSPKDPSNYLALARVEAAQNDLDKAAANLEKAIELKNDYAPARFLLVQIYDAQGKLSNAVKRAEELVSLNVNDVGSLFQLGFLYYKNNQFNEAGAVFERTVELSPAYSNARYFLGLVYDRDNNKEKALEQFEKIAELNPDNEEVVKIVANLKAGKAALTGITPPAPAPQNRAEAPVSEGEEPAVEPLKK